MEQINTEALTRHMRLAQLQVLIDARAQIASAQDKLIRLQAAIGTVEAVALLDQGQILASMPVNSPESAGIAPSASTLKRSNSMKAAWKRRRERIAQAAAVDVTAPLRLHWTQTPEGKRRLRRIQRAAWKRRRKTRA